MSADETERLRGIQPNRIELSDGSVVSWPGDQVSQISGCESEVHPRAESIIGCPVYVWADDEGVASRVLGATYLNSGREGSVPFWGIPGELRSRSGTIGAMSTGEFEFSVNESSTQLEEFCGSTPWWEIDPDSGTVMGFVGWGRDLFEDPCGWNV